ncbi:LuxR C-terminal-related transcriptional regulator [Anaerovorax odorimutans]|uniref:LuxR C-terminal-related transcriptional regulator n=1 Tax=Anaerovorax odorimutans TaxID=109327 RepID=UPI00040BA4A2|nr:LuxR C-terminal-related transcriptional regulator [Anaerovorax odorimutans]
MINQQHLLNRERINDELSNIFKFPLTVAVAAMGYGKTTAAKEFLRNSKADYIWLSIERDESSPQFIWDSITRQLAKTRPELGNQLRMLGFPMDAAQSYKIKQIIEDHAYLSNTVVVIDDYHFAHSTLLDAFIESIVRSNIEGLHILILSRTIPEMAIEELELKNCCYLIKNLYFEFTVKEIAEYFQLYGFKLSGDIIEKAYAISEGWISAVYLIMKRYADIGILETGRSIERLFETAVMPRYTDKEVMLLKCLCLLDSFTPQQAVYVTGNDEAARIIENLSYSNSFIRFDEQSGVFQIHNIFNDYLKKLLEEKPQGIKVDELYERSGTWCIENGDILLGLKYYRKSQKYDLILKEFKNQSITRIVDSNPNIILELFEQIPDEVKYNHPIAYIAYIGFYVTNVDIAVGGKYLAEVEERYKNDDNISAEMKTRIAGEIMLIRAYSSFNNVFLMHERFKAAHTLLNGESWVANKDKIVTFGSPHILYLYHRDKGQLLQTVECLEKLSPYYQELAGGCGVGFEYQLRAEYFLETCDFDKAENFAYKAIYKARTRDQFSIIICSNLTLMRICMVKGRFDEALDILDALGAEAGSTNLPIINSEIDLCTGYIQSINGEKSGFANWLKEGNISQSDVLYQGGGFNYIVYGKYLLIKEEYIKLEVLIEDMLQSFSLFNNILGIIHAYIQDAAVKCKLYGMETAESSLMLAIDIARHDHIMLPFAEYSFYIIELLKSMQKKSQKDEYLNQLVKYAEKYQKNMMGRLGVKTLEIKLSNREKQILKLMAEGKTNREIASDLFVAEVTVIKTITSIYRKLDISGRVSAVKKAMEMNLI